MRKILFVLTAAFALVGCEGSMEKYLRSQANDPEAVQFKDKVTYENWACVSVNGKNAFGGYVGFKRYTMKSFSPTADSSWSTISDNADCDADTLKVSKKNDDNFSKAEEPITLAVRKRVLVALTAGKLVAVGATNSQGLNDECALAVISAEGDGMLSLSPRYADGNGNDIAKTRYETRLDQLSRGSCAEIR